MSFAVDVYRLATLIEHSDGLSADIRSLADGLRAVLDAKIDAMAKRDAYSAYKTAPDGESREAARQKYLELIGVPDDWRWNASAAKDS
jgi:hypothetical protein